MDIWITFFPFKETIAGTNLLKEYGPVISSVIAAFSAMGCAFFSCKYQKKMAYSKMVLEQSKDIMAACYHCISIASVIDKRIDNNQRYIQFQEKAKKDINIIIESKDSLRFILENGSDGLRTITRITSWIDHKKDDNECRKKLIKSATDLRESIDKAFLYAIKKGKKPPQKMITKIISNSEKLYSIYNVSRNEDEFSEIEEQDSSSTPGA